MALIRNLIDRIRPRDSGPSAPADDLLVLAAKALIEHDIAEYYTVRGEGRSSLRDPVEIVSSRGNFGLRVATGTPTHSQGPVPKYPLRVTAIAKPKDSSGTVYTRRSESMARWAQMDKTAYVADISGMSPEELALELVPHFQDHPCIREFDQALKKLAEGGHLDEFEAFRLVQLGAFRYLQSLPEDDELRPLLPAALETLKAQLAGNGDTTAEGFHGQVDLGSAAKSGNPHATLANLIAMQVESAR